MKIVILNVKHNQQISFIWNQIGLEIGNSKNQKKYSSDGKAEGDQNRILGCCTRYIYLLGV